MNQKIAAFIYITHFLIISNIGYGQNFNTCVNIETSLSNAVNNNLDSLKINNLHISNNTKYISSFALGTTIQYSGVSFLGIESGVQLSQTGWKNIGSIIDSSSVVTYNSTLRNINIKLPILAYIKLKFNSGGSFILGGGMEYTYSLMSFERHKLGSLDYSSYTQMQYPEQFNTFNTGYQLLIGIEDSDFSFIRLNFRKNLNSLMVNTSQSIIPYSFGLAFGIKI